MINSKEDLELVKTKKINGIILSIKDLSINSSYFINPDELDKISKELIDKEIFISLNKIMHNQDLEYLKEVLLYLNNKSFKVLFYDLAVLNIVKKNNLNIDLVIYQDHLNASIYSHNVFKENNVNYSFITSDITLEEINEIKNETRMELIKFVYGYLPIFYSRRYLLTNYFTYIKKKKEDNFYYLKENDCYYPIHEEQEGTAIYTKEKINLINELDSLGAIDYLVINSYKENNLEEIIEIFLNKKKDNGEHYIGFLHTKTIFKVKE